MSQLGRLKILIAYCQNGCASRNIPPLSSSRRVNYRTFRTCVALKVFDLIPDSDPVLLRLHSRVVKVMDGLRSAGHEVPDTLSNNDWQELLKELRQLGSKKKIIERVVETYFADDANPKNYDTDGILRNTFLRNYDSSDFEQLHNNRLAHAVCYGQDLVVDLNYSDYMTRLDNESLVRQIAVLHNINKLDKDPFHLHLCNIKADDDLLKELKEAVPSLYSSKPLVTVTEKNYLDLFPKERLVLMTPDTTEDLVEFNPEDIYIIGGMVTRGWDVPATYPKAQQEGIRACRLPLDKYLFWGVGRKALTLYAVVNILLSLKNKANWKTALEHIPPNCLYWHPPGSSRESRSDSVEEAIWPSPKHKEDECHDVGEHHDLEEYHDVDEYNVNKDF